MTRPLAERALAELLGSTASDVRLLARGRTSTAWAGEIEGVRWVVRVPTPDSGRRLTYRAEMALGRLLHSRGHPVAAWQVVVLNGTPCAVARLLPGSPVEYGEAWSAGFASDLGSMLSDLHSLPVTGWGPLVDDATSLSGTCASPSEGVLARWCHASIWPFDETDLRTHPVGDHAADVLPVIADLEPAIHNSLQEPTGLVHSDLHREHLLQDSRGRLSGVLDFGVAFVGSTAWDFSSLHWYYGEANAQRVAEAYPGGAALCEQGALLAVALGLYKLARSPEAEAPRQRLRRCVDAFR